MKTLNSLFAGLLIAMITHLSQHFLLQKTLQAAASALAPSDTVYFLRNVPKGIYNSIESLGIFELEEAGACSEGHLLFVHPPKSIDLECQVKAVVFSNIAIVRLQNTAPKTSLYVAVRMQKILQFDAIFFVFSTIFAWIIFNYMDRTRALQERLLVEAEVGRIVGQIGHDIRGPIGALLAVPELIGPMNLEAIQIIKIVSDRLTSISSEILGKFRKIKLDFKPIGLLELFLSAAKLVRSRLSEQDQIIIDKSLENVFVMADKSILERVVWNMISNSIEAKKPDLPLVINVSAKSLRSGVVIAIKDNGKGFTISLFQRLFHKTPESKKIGGTGLGLSGSRRFLAQLGMTISFQSQAGVGTTLLIHIPKKLICHKGPGTKTTSV